MQLSALRTRSRYQQQFAARLFQGQSLFFFLEMKLE